MKLQQSYDTAVKDIQKHYCNASAVLTAMKGEAVKVGGLAQVHSFMSIIVTLYRNCTLPRGTSVVHLSISWTCWRCMILWSTQKTLFNIIRKWLTCLFFSFCLLNFFISEFCWSSSPSDNIHFIWFHLVQTSVLPQEYHSTLWWWIQWLLESLWISWELASRNDRVSVTNGFFCPALLISYHAFNSCFQWS